MNATVAIVDDGLDMYSDDLKDNYVSSSFLANSNRENNRFLIITLVRNWLL